MQITRFNVGEIFSLSHTKAGGPAYRYGNKYWYLSVPKREVPKDGISYAKFPEERGPFERADFGDRDRFVWPCGACAMQQEVPFASWAKRYAIWFEGSSLCAVDATRTLVVRLDLPMQIYPFKSVAFDDGTAYFQSTRDVLLIHLAAVEGLFDRASGVLEVQVHEHYPHQRSAATARMFVEYVFNDTASLVDRDGDAGWIRIPRVPGLVEGEQITLYDELMKDHYREIEVPGYARFTLNEKRPSELVEACLLAVEPAVDPAGPLTKASTAVRADELDRVLALLADDPDDDAARIVVVDLLEDAGEPYAAHFAKLLAGDTTDDTRREALGTLASYLDEVEWRGGLPCAATLSASAPNDDDIGNLVAADHRLGFFHTLRLGDGSFRVYNKLVASPRAVGLRHVDGSRAAILQALITGGRRDLRRLSNVKFANREVLEALADPTFDHVVEIETETQAHVVERLLEFITRDELKFFARAKRHLLLRERDGDDERLVEPVRAAWNRLPLDKVTIGDVTLTRV